MIVTTSILFSVHDSVATVSVKETFFEIFWKCFLLTLWTSQHPSPKGLSNYLFIISDLVVEETLEVWKMRGTIEVEEWNVTRHSVLEDLRHPGVEGRHPEVGGYHPETVDLRWEADDLHLEVVDHLVDSIEKMTNVQIDFQTGLFKSLTF